MSFASGWDELDAPDSDNHHGRAVSVMVDKRMTCVPADSLAVSWNTAGALSSVSTQTTGSLKGLNTLSSKVTSVLSTSYADSEFRDALSLLDGRGIQNTAEARRNLRLDLQREVIESNGEIIDEFGRVAEQLRRIGNTLEKLNKSYAEMKSQVTTAHECTSPVLQEASTLIAQKRQVETKQRLLKSFSGHFLLPEDEVAILTLTSEPVDDRFFNVLAKARRIRKDCEILLGFENQTLGLQIMEQTSRNLDLAFQKLYRWIQREFKTLNLESPQLGSAIRRALRTLAERPSLFQNCLDFFAEARETVLSDAFFTALTGTTSGGTVDHSVKPIEMAAHDPLRYVGDMLAWSHSATVSEREALEVLFVSDGDAIAKGIQSGRDTEVWRLVAEDGEEAPEFDPIKALNELVDRNVSGAARFLRQRIEQVIQTNEETILAYKLANLLGFYGVMFAKLLTEESILVECIRNLEAEALRQFRSLMRDYIANLQGDFQHIPPNLEPPDFLVLSLQQLDAIMKTYETSLTASGDREADFQPVLAEALDPFIAGCRNIGKALDPPKDSVFLINCLMAIKRVLMPYDFTKGRVEDLGEEIGRESSKLSESQYTFFREASGLAEVFDAVKPLTDKPEDVEKVRTLAPLAPVALAQASQRLDDFLPSALLDALENIKYLQDSAMARNITEEAADKFCLDFEHVEYILIDARPTTPSMDVDSPFSDLLRTTYDECFSEAQSAVALEEQDAIAPADQRWRAVVGRIKYLRSLLPQEHAFKHETDRNAMKGLRELELTAQEHLDLHEGLRLSLQSLNINQPAASSNRSNWVEQDDGLAYGASYQSAPRPPLPSRGTSSPNHSTAAVVDSRSSSDTEPIPPHTDTPALSSSSAGKPAPPSAADRKSDRSGSPGRHKFRTTLRTGKPGFRPRNAGPTAPGADMAAAAAWTSKDSRVYRERSPSSEGSPRVAAAGARTQAYLASLSSSSDQYTMRFDRHTRRLVPKEKSRAEERSHSSEAADSAAAAMRSMSESARASGTANGVNDSNTAAAIPALARQAARRSGEAAATSRTRRSADVSRPSLTTAPPGRADRSYSGSSRRERRVKEEPITLASNGASAKTHDGNIPSSTEGEDAGDTCEDPSSMTWEAKRAWVLRNIPPGVEGPTAAQILDEIDPTKDVVHWKEIAGLDEAKNALKEAVVYPFLRPDLFRGLREPPRGILLFGPPGTGKTMLARAVATESESTYIAVTASTLNSKYLGESEKHVRALFTVAKMLAPSIIFIDEVDSVLSKRSSSGEHEASRRLKTEFLIQWSSLEKANTSVKQLNGGGSGDNRVLVLAATNRPWDLDDAATRRFARRQYIPLPESETRSVQLQKLLESELKHCLTESDVEELVRLTEGYSGSDITHLARQASYGPLRSHGEAVLRMTSEEIRPIDMSDFVACLRTVRPSVNQSSLKQFEEWARQFGETI
ncbi:hypothetical protein PpBr36_03098 [Pyricularia pennisetigena]|uniref:hypothetical protein n=1 Tax=Pyricularia pennisetigena TaxID=1578925 RepID=UPI00114E613F|nr:hypothetical protein PpBr36_03098 [Pyricularia pennisetigena]TLS30397.1 hypothetical protein PpBr36_03098 [Pyricularia pennisetigena]